MNKDMLLARERRVESRLEIRMEWDRDEDGNGMDCSLVVKWFVRERN